MATPVDELKNRLKIALTNCNMKPIELSEITNIPKSSISQYMSGYAKPNGERIYLMSKALNVSEAWLLGFDTSMERIADEYVISQEQRDSLPTKDDMTIAMFKQLDDDDKAEIRGEIKQMLKADKYISGSDMVTAISKELKNTK